MMRSMGIREQELSNAKNGLKIDKLGLFIFVTICRGMQNRIFHQNLVITIFCP